MLHLLIALAAGIAGFILARSFVRRRLRFVDGVHSPIAPLIAGCVQPCLAWPAVLASSPGTTFHRDQFGSVLDWALQRARAVRDGEGLVGSLPDPYYCVVRDRQ